MIIINKILMLFLLMFVAVALIAPVSVQASIKSDVCSGIGIAAGGECKDSATGSKSVNDTIKTALNFFSALIGVIAVVMIMIAGVKYMTSQGEPGKINEAKNALLYAVVGIVVVAMAQIIVQFVIKRFS